MLSSRSSREMQLGGGGVLLLCSRCKVACKIYGVHQIFKTSLNLISSGLKYRLGCVRQFNVGPLPALETDGRETQPLNIVTLNSSFEM